MTVPEAPKPGLDQQNVQREPGGDAPAAAPPPPPAPQPPLAPLPPAAAPAAPGQPVPTSQTIGLDPSLIKTPLAPSQPSANTPTDESNGGKTWEYDSGVGNIEPRSATQVLSTLAGKVAEGDVTQYQPVPLGFTPVSYTHLTLPTTIGWWSCRGGGGQW